MRGLAVRQSSDIVRSPFKPSLMNFILSSCASVRRSHVEPAADCNRPGLTSMPTNSHAGTVDLRR